MLNNMLITVGTKKSQISPKTENARKLIENLLKPSGLFNTAVQISMPFCSQSGTQIPQFIRKIKSVALDLKFPRYLEFLNVNL